MATPWNTLRVEIRSDPESLAAIEELRALYDAALALEDDKGRTEDGNSDQ